MKSIITKAILDASSNHGVLYSMLQKKLNRGVQCTNFYFVLILV